MSNWLWICTYWRVVHTRLWIVWSSRSRMLNDFWQMTHSPSILMFLQSKHLDVLRTHVFMDRKLMLKKWELQCKKRPSRFHWNTSLFHSPRVLIVIDEDPVSGKFAEPHDILQLDLQFPSHSPSFHIFHLLSWMGFPTSMALAGRRALLPCDSHSGSLGVCSWPVQSRNSVLGATIAECGWNGMGHLGWIWSEIQTFGRHFTAEILPFPSISWLETWFPLDVSFVQIDDGWARRQQVAWGGPFFVVA